MRQYLPVELARLLKSATSQAQGVIRSTGRGLEVSYRGKRQQLPKADSLVRSRVRNR